MSYQEVYDHKKGLSRSGSYWTGLVKRGGGARSRGLGAGAGRLELPNGLGRSVPRNERCVPRKLTVAVFAVGRCSHLGRAGTARSVARALKEGGGDLKPRILTSEEPGSPGRDSLGRAVRAVS